MANDLLSIGNGAPGGGAANRMSGQLRIVSGIEGRGRTASVPSSGMAEAVSGLASEFGKVGAKIGALADHAAAVEGAEAGRLAGLDPEFRATKTMTIRGEAFDKAGLQVMETRMRSGMLADMEAVYEQHGSDPAALSAKLAEKGRVWISEADPQLRPDLEVSYEGAALRINREATRRHMARIASEHAAAAAAEASDGLKRAHQMAYAGGLDELATQSLAKDRTVYERVLTRTDFSGNPLFTPEQRRKLVEQYDESVTTARILGAYDRLNGLAAKQQFIDDFEADFAASKGLAQAFDLGGFRAITSQLRNGLTQEQSAANVAARALGAEVKSIVTELANGAIVPPEQMSAIEGRLATIGGGSAEIAQNVAEARMFMTLQERVRLQPPAAAEALSAEITRDMAATGVAPEKSAARRFLDSFADKARAGLKEDALGWAEHVGRVSLTPLDLTSAETASATMRARIAARDEVAAAFGVDAPYLRPDEKRAFAEAAAQGGEQMLAITSAVAGAAGDRAPKIIAEVGKDAPVVAFVAGHVVLAGETKVARDIADGIAMAREQGTAFKARVGDKGQVAIAANDVLGAALARMPSTLNTVIAAASAAYEIRARRQLQAGWDPTLFKSTLREAIGERTVGDATFGGIVRARDRTWPYADDQHLILPPFVRQDAWREVIGMINEGDLDRAGLSRPAARDGTRLPITALRDGVLVHAGDAKYRIAMGDPATEGEELWVADGAGKPFVLDLEALRPILAKRRPDLVLGGR